MEIYKILDKAEIQYTEDKVIITGDNLKAILGIVDEIRFLENLNWLMRNKFQIYPRTNKGFVCYKALCPIEFVRNFLVKAEYKELMTQHHRLKNPIYQEIQLINSDTKDMIIYGRKKINRPDGNSH